MRIEVSKIPPEGLTLTEELLSRDLDLETDLIRFKSPIKLKAQVSKITNAITVDLTVEALMSASCSRCLELFEMDFKKAMQLNYAADKSTLSIDLNPDIRQELILDYPVKPLCNSDCKGLCPKCGRNLNEGKCNC